MKSNRAGKGNETAEDKQLNIGTFDCWKCKKPMKICWITGVEFYGPERFTDYEIKRIMEY